MSGRLTTLVLGLLIGLLLAWGLPELSQRLSGRVLSSTAAPDAPAASNSGEPQDMVKLNAEAIAAAGIEVAPVASGAITRSIVVPATIVPEADRIAHVSVKLSSIVAELRKNIGDPVAENEVVAVLESREVADAKSEYLAARLTNDLQQDLFERDKVLWDKRVSSEQQYLRSRNDALRAQMRNDIARQKLFALGLTEPEIAGLPEQPEALLRRQDVRSPVSGHVVERKVELGVAVGRDNLETELFVIADLDRVWVELAVNPKMCPWSRSARPCGSRPGGPRTKRTARSSSSGRCSTRTLARRAWSRKSTMQAGSGVRARSSAPASRSTNGRSRSLFRWVPRKPWMADRSHSCGQTTAFRSGR